MIAVWCLSLVLLLSGAWRPADAGTAQATWTAPRTNINGQMLTEPVLHRIYYGRAPGTYDAHLEVGEATTATVEGLAAGQTYYFAVSARTASSDESLLSSEVAFTVATSEDVTPPTVAIVHPTAGSAVIRLTTVIIRAEASEETASVLLWVTNRDGSVVLASCQDTSMPYTCSWQVPGGKRKTYRLRARATDQVGNVGIAPIVTVTSR